MKRQKILIWLPSPLGDAVMATPALRAIRQKYKDAEICFLGNAQVKAVLSDGPFNDVVKHLGKLLDIEVLDHLVIGDGRWVSLRERGLGFD